MKKENKTWKTKKLLLHYFSETVDFSPGEVIADARAELTQALTKIGYIKRVRLYDSIVPCFNIKTALLYNNDGKSANTLSCVEDFLCENCVVTGVKYSRINEEEPPEYNRAVVPAITILGFDDRVDLIDNIVIKNCVIRKTEEQGQNILINNFNGVTIENLKVK